jgi:signal transduction histidine kinase
MPDRLICENDHAWEPPPGAVPAAGGGLPLCPVCGARARETPDPLVTIDLQPQGLSAQGQAPQSATAEFEGPYPPQIPGYEILAELGRGSASLVFRALHVATQRQVALKVLAGQAAAQPVAVERFRREARVLARLDHPQVVPVYDAGDAQGRPHFAAKLLDGGSLRPRLPALTASPTRAARLLLELAEALEYVHAQGVIHCDLKPSNVLFDRQGAPYLCDFGAARAGGQGPGEGEAGVVFGTPAYAAPELTVVGGVPGPTSDVYALGVILFEMLTGRLPFEAASPAETVRLLWTAEPPRPRTFNPDCPGILESLCLWCLRKAPEQRPASAGHLAQKLRAFLAVSEEAASLPPAPRRPPEPAEAAPPPPAEAPWQQAPPLEAGVRAMAEGVLLLDAAGKVTTANPAAARIFGRDLTGLSLPDWLRSQDWLGPDAATPLAAQALPPMAVLLGRPAAEAEVYLAPGERPHGAWLILGAWPLADAGTAGAVVVARDITSRKAERDSAELYHSLSSALGLHLFRKDLQGRYTFVGRPFCDALGRPPEEILGRTDFDLFPADLARVAGEREGRALRAAEVTEHVEEHTAAQCQPGCRCRLFRDPRAAGGGAGEPCYFQMLLGPARDEAGRVAGIQGAFWDITARRRAERQLEQTAAALRQANAELARSNNDLQQFAYVASHDLQEPLRMVASFTQLLQKRYQGQLDAQADRYIHFAVDGATRMQGLINDLLAYSRVGSQSRPLQQVSTEEALEKALQNLGEAVRESRATVTHGPLPRLRGDLTQLTQLFQNLVGNALKFRGPAPPQVHVGARRDAEGKGWVFSVQDNGIGIDPRYLERIFVIFQRLHTKQEHPGSGIGLAICRRIVERHGGRLWAESEPGKGSVFHFTLPAG